MVAYAPKLSKNQQIIAGIGPQRFHYVSPAANISFFQYRICLTEKKPVPYVPLVSITVIDAKLVPVVDIVISKKIQSIFLPPFSKQYNAATHL